MQTDILKTLFSPAYIQRMIENSYKLNTINDTILIRTSSNDIYKIITIGSQYIFKIFNINKKLKDLEFEIAYTLYLNANNILVSFPLKSLENQYFVYLDYPEGKKIAILTNYIEGNQLKYTFSDTYLFGKNVAKLHDVSKKFYISNEKNKIYNILEIFLEKKIIIENFLKQYYSKYFEFFSYFSNMLLSSLENIKFAEHYCHNDLHTDNTKKIANDIYFFDFDFSGYGYTIYELSVFKWSCMLRNKMDIWLEFVKGYKSILNIDKQEFKYILHFVAMRDILVMSLFINRINIIGHKTINDSYIEQRIKFLKNINKQIIKRC